MPPNSPADPTTHNNCGVKRIKPGWHRAVLLSRTVPPSRLLFFQDSGVVAFFRLEVDRREDPNATLESEETTKGMDFLTLTCLLDLGSVLFIATSILHVFRT